MIDYQDVTKIFGHRAPLAREAAGILWRPVSAAIDIAAVGHVFRIGVSDGSRQPGRVPLLHFHLQRVILRGGVVGAIRYISYRGINSIQRSPGALRARPWKRLIVVVV